MLRVHVHPRDPFPLKIMQVDPHYVHCQGSDRSRQAVFLLQGYGGVMFTLTRDQARKLDQLAIHRLGMPGLLLMENAARGATAVILSWSQSQLHQADSMRVVIVCGAGNNGGDGLAIARHLDMAGVQVSVYLTRPPEDFSGDAGVNLKIARNLGLPIHIISQNGPDDAAIAQWKHANLLIDAILGTGFNGHLRSPLDRIITAINRTHEQGGMKIVAIDLPSGLDADTGQPSQPTIMADLTITLAARKQGFAASSAQPFLGQVVVSDIGLPSRLIQEAMQMES